MGVPAMMGIRSIDELEVSLLVFLIHTFPALLVGAQENYADDLGRYRLGAETRAALLVKLDRTDYATTHRLRMGTLAYTHVAKHVFSILVLCAAQEDGRELLADLREASPFYFPSGMPDYVFYPVSEQYEGEVDGLHHFAATYQLAKSALPGLQESRRKDLGR